MDRQLRAEIVATVQKVVMEANEIYGERWLTAKQLCEYVGVFTERWLKDHGYLLPRTPAEWDDDEGHHVSSYMYPLHKILAMMADGRIKRLT